MCSSSQFFLKIDILAMKSKEFVYALFLLVFALMLTACESDADVAGSLVEPSGVVGNLVEPSGALSEVVVPSIQDGKFRLLPLADTDNAHFDGDKTHLTASKFETAFLKFDLKDIQNVDQATLKLYVETAKGASPVGKAIPVSDDSWTEDSSNLPRVNLSASAIGESEATPEGKYLSIDITDYIKSELSNDSVATVAFKTDQNNWLSFGSKESGNPPELEVQGTMGGTVPAPAVNPGSVADQSAPVEELVVTDNQTPVATPEPTPEPEAEPASAPDTPVNVTSSANEPEPNEPVTEAPEEEVVTTVQNQSPRAVFSADPTHGIAPVIVTVNASGSSDPDGSIVSYNWDFGDGSKGTGVTATHNYSNEGDYSLKLTVEDNVGSSASATTKISVQKQPVASSSGQCENPGPDYNMAVPSGGALAGDKPRVFVTTDIRPFSSTGEYDDKLSTISLMLFLDVIDLEGIAGNPDPIRKIIGAYQKDLDNLRSYSSAYPDPGSIKVSKSYSAADGADLLLEAAKKSDSRPLYVLTWGDLRVVARALEKAEQENFDLASKIRLLSIGLGNVHASSGPRPSFIDVYAKVKQGKLWMVLDQQSHRGIFGYGKNNLPAGNWKSFEQHGPDNFVDHHIKGHGNLGQLYYGVKRNTRMGDFPTLLYLLRGNPTQPTSDHWGGRFISLNAAHKFGSSAGADTGIRNFWTDTQAGDESYNNPWRRSMNHGTRKMMAQYAMQWLPEFSARYDRAKYRKGSNPSPMDVFKYTNRCR